MASAPQKECQALRVQGGEGAWHGRGHLVPGEDGPEGHKQDECVVYARAQAHEKGHGIQPARRFCTKAAQTNQEQKCNEQGIEGVDLGYQGLFPEDP